MPTRSADEGPHQDPSAHEDGRADEHVVPARSPLDPVRIESHRHQYRAAVPLSQEQLRLLGCLMEKERTTPDDYPLTANSLMRAANQSTSRDPVVDYDQRVVESSMVELKDLGLIRFVFSPSNRATKYRHVLDEAWRIDEQEAAVLTLLMLRGPQTPGELRSRAGRLATFPDVEDVRATLRRLATRDEPMVAELSRIPGHKENRWAQLLGDAPAVDAAVAPTITVRSGPGPAAAVDPDRVSALEAEVATLRRLVDELRAELGLAVGDGG
jgi:uncharacterized protein